MHLTRVLSLTSTPRRASTFCVYRPRLSPSSGRITQPECTSNNSQHLVAQVWVERQRFPHEVDRKSTRLNSSHSQISYAVFCLKKNMTSLGQLGYHVPAHIDIAVALHADH